MKLHFLGGADSVTGSKHWVEMAGTQLLLDCGLFQGFKVLRERNWQRLPIDLKALDAVVLSHAHLDHSGWLPVLVRQGFHGPVIATPATRDLADVLLRDSAKLQEDDARRANRGGWSRHAKALPLYSGADAVRAVARIRAQEAGSTQRIGKVDLTLTPVGHLLGACAVTLRARGETLVFSGDLGRRDDLLLPAPERVPRADVLLVESTYGNRLHPKDHVEQQLGEIVRRTIARGGSVLLPAFAVGRAQALLLVLQRLRASGGIPRDLPIFLDSPMAIEATHLTRRYRKLLRVSAREITSLGDGVRFVETGAQSERLSRSRWPSVIISASGMATGGRVLHHLKALAPHPQHHIVFAGFQVGGTRGALLVGGAREVKIHGEMVPVRAEVSGFEGLSGHADADEILDWLRGFRAAPRQTWVVHGDPAAADALRFRIQQELGWRVGVPEHGQVVES